MRGAGGKINRHLPRGGPRYRDLRGARGQCPSSTCSRNLPLRAETPPPGCLITPVRVRVCVCVHGCECECMHVSAMHTTCTAPLSHTHAHTHTHTHTHTHMHTHTHERAWARGTTIFCFAVHLSCAQCEEPTGKKQIPPKWQARNKYRDFGARRLVEDLCRT